MKKLCYPDGDEVKVGDIVWLREGINVREVTQIITKDHPNYEHYRERGFLYTRYIGKKKFISKSNSLGIQEFCPKREFEVFAIGKLTSCELLFLELMYRLFEKQTNSKLIDGDLLYYPIWMPEQKEDGHWEFRWYLIVSHDCPPSYGTELCYRFHENLLLFEQVNNETRERIRPRRPDGTMPKYKCNFKAKLQAV